MRNVIFALARIHEANEAVAKMQLPTDKKDFSNDANDITSDGHQRFISS